MNPQRPSYQRWLFVLAPAALVVAVYGLSSYRTRQATRRQLEGRIRVARQDVEAPALVAARQAEVDELQGLVDAELEAVQGDHGAKPSVNGTLSTLATLRNETRAMAELGRILESRGLITIAATRLAEGHSGNRIPPDVRESLRRLAQSEEGVGIWRFDLIGDFHSMLGALVTVEKINALVVPLAVSMDPLPNDGTKHLWRLWLWM
jgi:type II secretory pathway pseudopilin PulG